MAPKKIAAPVLSSMHVYANTTLYNRKWDIIANPDDEGFVANTTAKYALGGWWYQVKFRRIPKQPYVWIRAEDIRTEY